MKFKELPKTIRRGIIALIYYLIFLIIIIAIMVVIGRKLLLKAVTPMYFIGGGVCVLLFIVGLVFIINLISYLLKKPKIPTWLQTGIIGIIISFSLTHYITLRTLISYLQTHGSSLDTEMGFLIVFFPLAIIISSIIFFIIGALIGLIIGKIKSK